MKNSIQSTLCLLVAIVLSSKCFSAQTILLDPNQQGRIFEGLGAVSAGASTRLLVDYPEPQRSQILDYLFKPGYGAALQHLKVEIGGEVNSTDGTEPTHMRTREGENYQRGYEWWLMKEAKARNPAIMLDCLAWGAPGWIGGGNYWSQDMADYVVKFIQGAKIHHNLDIDYTGIRNETGYDTNWIVTLRTTLDANGLANVKIIGGDEWGGRWNIVGDMLANPGVYNAIHAVGVHYPNAQSPAEAKMLGKPIWSSEDGIGGSTWYRAGYLAGLFNRNYITGKMTKTEIWSPITSYYDNLLAADSGLMRANTPWSGNYVVAPAVWVTAHTTQFAWPGWRYLEAGASDLLPGGGSMVTLKSTNNLDYSIVVETIGAGASQSITFRLTNGLSSGPVRVWRTTQSTYFSEIATVTPLGGAFTFNFQPDAIYTLTTTSGQGRGAANPPPESPFPLPYKEDFESYPANSTPRYLSDQAGTFEVVDRPDDGGKCLRQVLPQVGIRWLGEFYPYTLMGESGWRDYDVSSEVFIESNGSAFVMGRIGKIPGFDNVTPPGYWLKIATSPGSWELRSGSGILASGSLTVPPDQWHKLRLAMIGTTIRGWVNGIQVAQVTDASHANGLAAIGCGWHHARFDNFTLRRLHSGVGNLALTAVARASSIWSGEYSADKANDSDNLTRWNSGWPMNPEEWLELDFGGPTRFSHVTLSQFDDRIQSYKLQSGNGGAWSDLVLGTQMGLARAHSFPTVTNSKVRLLVTASTTTPSIYEFAVYEDAPVTNLSPAATATSSSDWSTEYTAEKANDGDFDTRWNAAPGKTNGEWIQLDWPQPVTFNRVQVSQFGERIGNYKLQRWTGVIWADVVSDGPLGSGRTHSFPSVTASRVRFLVVTASNIPSIWEFQLFNDPAPFAATAVRFNEWMLNNVSTLRDPADDQFESWFELFNAGTNLVDLAGYFIGTSSTDSFRFQIPDGVTLAPGAHLLAWADQEPGQYQPGGDLHVNFSMAAGQRLVLTAPDGRQLDAVELEPLAADQSQGSKPDGDLAILPLARPTPRSSNNLLVISGLSHANGAATWVRVAGMPFAEHQLQFAEELGTPNWLSGPRAAADALGLVELIYQDSTNRVRGFFRAVTAR